MYVKTKYLENTVKEVATCKERGCIMIEVYIKKTQFLNSEIIYCVNKNCTNHYNPIGASIYHRSNT